MLALALNVLMATAVLGECRRKRCGGGSVVPSPSVPAPPATPAPPPTQQLCTITRKMGCKQRCPPGWRLVRISDFGCCKNFWSCGGNRKTCRKQFYADSCHSGRRRTEGEDFDAYIGEADDTEDGFPFEEEEDTGFWEHFSPRGAVAKPSAPAVDGLADRLLDAEIRTADGASEGERVPPEAEFLSTSEESPEAEIKA